MKEVIENLDLNMSEELPMVEVPIDTTTNKKQAKKNNYTEAGPVKKTLVNCLRNERVIVRLIPKESSMITNPKHVLYGGMSEKASRTFIVPKMSSGMYVNILTDDEKAYLENIMGLEENALSVYRKVDNFWDDSSESGINKVRLMKQDNYLDLSDPEEYIKYKILLANKDLIAPSLEVMASKPKATYQFVIISEGDETKQAKDKMSVKMRCYKEFWKVENDIDVLRLIIETIDGRPTAPTSKLEFLQARADNLIVADSKLFYKVITDELLNTKVLIKKATEAGIIQNRGGMLYLRSDGSPLCEHNEEPTINIAAKYLNSPKRQDILFGIQAKLK